jgi:hypothetical protein
MNRCENQSAMESAEGIHNAIDAAASKAELTPRPGKGPTNFSTNWPLAEIEEMANPKRKFTTACPA